MNSRGGDNFTGHIISAIAGMCFSILKKHLVPLPSVNNQHLK